MSKREPVGDWVDGIDCFADEITCPHCLEIDDERTDYPRSLERDGDATETDCSVCGKQFKVTMCVEYSFKTEKIKWPTPSLRQ